MFRVSKIASKICRLFRLANNSAGRTSAEILLPDGMNLNQELVKQGWCCWYRKYAPADTVLEGLEWGKHEKPRKACGLLRLRCRRGSGGSGCCQRERANWTAVGAGVEVEFLYGEWDQLPRVSIQQHGGGCFLSTHNIPQSSPNPR